MHCSFFYNIVQTQHSQHRIVTSHDRYTHTFTMKSGPVRRNFERNGHSSSQQQKGRSAMRIFVIILFGLIAILSTLAIHLSREVMHQSSLKKSKSSLSHHHHSGSGRTDRRSDNPGTAMKDVVDDSLSDNNNKIAISSSSSSTNNNNNKNGKDRVYCMIPFIWNEEIYKVIMETWGKRCDVINFLTDALVGGKLKGDKITEDPMGYRNYTDFPKGTFPENVIFINMTRSWNDCPLQNGVKKVCRHIWEKMWRSWVYVEENHLDQAEWFCKVDYDTFFFPDNVKYFVNHKKWNALNEYHYFGHMIQHRQKGREPMIAGATACWSRKTLDDIADVYRAMPKGSQRGERGRCEDRAEATEEASTSHCLKKHLNVSAYPARDDELRECITVAKYKDQLTWNRTEQGEWWYWKGKPKGAGEMENSISFRPIGLHKYKQAWEILELEQQFFGKPDNDFVKRLNDRTRTYVQKVRRAMGTDPSK